MHSRKAQCGKRYSGSAWRTQQEGWFHRRKRISGDMDIRTPVYAERAARIYSAVEIVVAGKSADDTATLRDKADKRLWNRKAVQDNRIVDAEGGHDY